MKNLSSALPVVLLLSCLTAISCNKKEIEDADGRIDKMDNELRSIKESVELQSSIITNCGFQLIDLQKEFDSFHKRVSNFLEEYESAMEAYADSLENAIREATGGVGKQVEEAKRLADSLKTAMAAATDSLNIRIVRSKAYTDSLLGVVETMAAQLEAKVGELENLPSRMDSAFAKIARDSAEIASISAAVSRIAADVETIKADHNDINTRIAVLEVDRANLSDKVDAIAAEVLGLKERVQSVVFVPRFRGGCANLPPLFDGRSFSYPGRLALEYRVKPAKSISDAASKWTEGSKVFRLWANVVAASQKMEELPIKSVTFNSGGDSLLTVEVDYSAVKSVLEEADGLVAVSLEIRSGSTLISSPFTEVCLMPYGSVEVNEIPFIKGKNGKEAVFSVSSTKKVKFTKGNLMATWHHGFRWGFTPSQAFVAGDSNLRLGNPAEGDNFDLFGWSADTNYYGICSSGGHSADYHGEYRNWGGLFGGGLRILSIEEWEYLFTGRSDELKFAKVSVQTDSLITGVFVMPDGWTESNWPYGCRKPACFNRSQADPKPFSVAEFSALENEGVLFLPAEFMRDVNEFRQSCTYYRAVGNYDDGNNREAWSIADCKKVVCGKCFGLNVRLVADINN